MLYEEEIDLLEIDEESLLSDISLEYDISCDFIENLKKKVEFEKSLDNYLL